MAVDPTSAGLDPLKGPSDPTRQNRPLLGIACRLLGSALFVGMAALVKMAENMPVGMTVFVRSILPAVALFAFFAVQGKLASLYTRRPVAHAVRAGYGLVTLASWFLALRILPLPDVQSLLYLTPMVNTLLAWLILKEHVGRWRAGALAVGLVGMVVIMAPKVTMDFARAGALVGLGLCLINSLTYSINVIHIRQLSQTEATHVLVFYFSLFIALFALLSLPFGWVVPSWHEVGLLLAIGTLGGIGQMLITASYRFAPVGLLAPFEYSALLYAIVIGAVVFGEYADANTLAGAALIVAAGLTVFFRERRAARRSRLVGPAPDQRD
ncbi:DMT family transporter [Tropicimonas isoalkanivorans]|uniref:Permease of the drug/metabolite transporter (DMT) superfamily n=1 Tax=Tropicimonas isoalkanivorans TaxID=441112 RepID=A0A1I1I2F4_9RHOB|nr:DMT family transporter [Tropicimonas isoalkanivorans]SFC28398.1 Permease of the drug/metabolite transporter (DMT) superfamily [Tropicimonas isoalkanivorans]